MQFIVSLNNSNKVIWSKISNMKITQKQSYLFHSNAKMNSLLKKYLHLKWSKYNWNKGSLISFQYTLRRYYSYTEIFHTYREYSTTRILILSAFPYRTVICIVINKVICTGQSTTQIRYWALTTSNIKLRKLKLRGQERPQ